MTERRSRGLPLIKGGAGAKRPLMRFEDRHIILTAHTDGMVRLWDVGHGDEIENEDMLQVDVARAVGRSGNVEVSCMSLSRMTGELSIGLRTGELVVFRWARNDNFGRDMSNAESSEALGLVDIQHRFDPDLKEGFLPLTLLCRTNAEVMSLCQSDAGFVAAGFRDGSVAAIDLRGPALIYCERLTTMTGPSKKSSIRKTSNNQNQLRSEWATIIEFGILSLEGEGKFKFKYGTMSLTGY